MIFRLTQITLLCLILFLSACGGDNAPAVAPAAPETIDEDVALFTAKGCIACHAVEPGDDRGLQGPSMIGLVSRSEETIASPNYQGQAETVRIYLRESIIKPRAYLVEGYEPIMPNAYQVILLEEELTALVDYLLTFE